jgi:hypothetical protein
MFAHRGPSLWVSRLKLLEVAFELFLGECLRLGGGPEAALYEAANNVVHGHITAADARLQDVRDGHAVDHEI